MFQYLEINRTNCINRSKKKYQVIILVNLEKAFDKIPAPLHHKNSQETKNREDLPQLNKDYLKRSKLTSYLIVKKWILPSKIRSKESMFFLIISIQHCARNPS